MANTLARNVRYAVSYLSPENQRFAIENEVMQDKITGEVYIKRKDGETISATRIKKSFMNEILDMRRALKLDSNTTLLSYDKEKADDIYHMYGFQYNILQLNRGIPFNIKKDNPILEFNDTSNPETYEAIAAYEANYPKDTLLFLRFNTRECDRLAVAKYTNEISSRITDILLINPNDPRALGRTERTSDCQLEVRLNFYINGNLKGTPTSRMTNTTIYVRLNELSVYDFKSIIDNENMTDISRVGVQVKSINASYMNFLKNNNSFDSFLALDKNIILDSVNARFFSDKQFSLKDGFATTEFVGDINTVRDLFTQLSTIVSSKSIIISDTKPSEKVWLPYNTWANEIRYKKRGSTYKTNDNKDKYIIALEDFIYNTRGLNIFFTQDPDVLKDALIKKKD